MNDASAATVDSVDITWDVLRPSANLAKQTLFTDSDAETFRMQQQFAVKNGVSADDFAKTYNSFTVNTDLARADEITRRYRVEGVPLFAVNGKYTTDIDHAGSEDKLIALLDACDQARFSPGAESAAAREAVLQRADAVLAALDGGQKEAA